MRSTRPGVQTFPCAGRSKRRYDAQAGVGTPDGDRPRRLQLVAARIRRSERGPGTFVFFSNRLGCFGSVLVSLVLTALVILVVSLVW
jgi:hypothetical protein